MSIVDLQTDLLNYAKSLPFGTLLQKKDFQHFGDVDDALLNLVNQDKFTHINAKYYVVNRKTRFGMIPPDVVSIVKDLAKLDGETISISGATAANMLGLSTQVPVNYVFWTSGPTCVWNVGNYKVKLQNVPEEQANLPDNLWGHIQRALIYLGKKKLSKKDISTIERCLTDKGWEEYNTFKDKL